MVGREAELVALVNGFEKASGGEAQLVLVSGEAGIGKTRLVRELVGLLPGDVVVAYGHAVPLANGALPYGLAGDLLRSLVTQVGPDAVAAALGKRTSLLSPLIPRFAEKPGTSVDRLAVIGASQDLLAELSQAGSLVLVVEDAHWADASSLELLMVWARTLVRGRLLLVMTSRVVGVGDDVLKTISHLRRLPNCTPIELDALSDDEVDAQVRSLDADLPLALMRDIRRLSDGNPLFVEELVAGGSTEPSRPLTVDLSARLDVLGTHAAVVRAAALEGRAFGSEELAAVAGRPVPDVERILDEAVLAGILTELPGAQWAFHHELLRQAAASSLPGSARLRGHRAWATTLNREPATPGGLVSVADHLAACGDTRQAFDARISAAEAVWGVASSPETIGQWMAALRMLDRAPALADEEEFDAVLGAATCSTSLWPVVAEILEIVDRRGVAGSPIRAALALLLGYSASRFW